MNETVAQSVTEKVQSYAPGTRRKRNPIQQAADLTIKAMLVQGASIRKVAAALNISPTTVSRVKARICEQSPDAADLKSGLMSPVRDENAGKLIDHFIGKGLKMKAIKGSDALGAVKLYADRRWPVRTEAAPPSRTFIQTNLNVFLPDSQPAPLDVTPTTIYGVEDGGNLEKPNNLNQFDTCSVRE